MIESEHRPPVAEIEDSELQPLIDSEYEHLLRDHNPIDGGQEGLIYYLKFSEFDPNFAKFVEEQVGHKEEAAAVKVLKLFRPGKARVEFEAQQKAYDLVEQAIAAEPGNENKYARIPRPVEYRQIKLSPETKQTIQTQGAKLDGDEVEILLMDYIDGQDLQELFYKWIIEHAPEDKQYAVIDTKVADFDTLHRAVTGILDFHYADPGASQTMDAEIIARRKKVYAFLKRTGFQIGANVVDQIRNTRKLLARNGLFHNDEHERNFMLSGNQVFMIDFARAGSSPTSEETELMIDVEMEKLSPEIEARKADEGKKELREKVEALSRDPNLETRFASAFKAAKLGSAELNQHLMSRAVASSGSETDVDSFLGLLVNFRDQKLITSSHIGEILDTMSESLKKPILKRGKITGFQNMNPAASRRINSYRELAA